MARFSLKLLAMVGLVLLCGAAASGQSITIVSGNGQVTCPLCLPNTIPFFDPLVVLVKNAAGSPAPNVPVTFTVTSGNGTVSGQSSAVVNTGADGTASVSFQQSAPFGFSFGIGFVQSTITATAQGASVQFTETTGTSDVASGVTQITSPQVLSPPTGQLLTGRAGETSTTPVQVRVSTISGAVVPGVEVRLVPTNTTDTNLPTATCQSSGAGAPGTVLTDATGVAICNVLFGGRTGLAQFNIQIGNKLSLFGPYNFEVTAGLPGMMTITSGNNQTGNSNQTLPTPLVATVTDASGTSPLANVPVVWTITPSTAGELVAKRDTTDLNGRVSTNLRLSGTGQSGTVTVAVAPGTATSGNKTLSATFNFTANLVISGLQKLAGDAQTAIVNQPFAQALVVQANNGNLPAPGVSIRFAVTSGSVTLSAATATTDAQGRASVNATAGATAGPAVVTASAGTFSAVFNLTVSPPGPQNIRFLNGAGFQSNAISPCSVATLAGTGLAPGLQGVVSPTLNFGPLPLTLANISVQFGNFFAPIYSVVNQGGQESVTVQVPCEVQPGNVSVNIRVGSGSGTFTAQVQTVAPGIFETDSNMSDRKRRAVLLKPDGSYATLENPVRKGEIARMYVTGIGLPSPAVPTNSPGIPGQDSTVDIANIVVGVNNAGVRVVSARYAPGLIGVYEIAFQVPSDAPAGVLPFAVAVSQGGNLVFGNPSTIPVQ